MELPEALRIRAAVVETNPNYSGPDLSRKIIIGLEGPFGAGKSTLTEQCIKMLREKGIDAGIIGTNTTRESRPNDPAHYVTEVDPELLVRRGEKGELINLTPFPTGHLYATSAESLPYDVNIGPLMPAAISKFREAGCKNVFVFYLTMSPEQWQKQLDLEQRLERPDAPRRIEEAVESLEHAVHSAEHPDESPQPIINNDGTQSIEQLASTILAKAGFQGFESTNTYTGNELRELYNYALDLSKKVAVA